MNERQVMTSGLVMLGMITVAWLFALPGWLAALLSAMAMLPLPWFILHSQRQTLRMAQATLNDSAQACLILDTQARILLANPAFLTLAQLSKIETLSALPEAWQEFITELHQKTLATGCNSAESLLPQANGGVLLRAHGLPFAAADGSPQIVLLWENLSGNAKQDPQHTSEQSLLARSQAFIQTLMDVIPQSVYIKRIDGAQSYYTQFNTAFCALHNRSRKALLGATSFDLFSDPALASMVNQEDLRVRDGMSVFREEERVDEQTGKTRFMIVSKQACEDAEGHTVIVGSYFDITPWRQAERQLAQALTRETALFGRTQAFTQRLIDLIPDEFYVKDADSRFMLVNQAFLNRRLIPNREEVIGRSMEEITIAMCKADPAYRDQPELLAGVIADHMERIKISLEEDQLVLAGQNLQKEDHHILPHSGEERFFLVAKSAATDAEGRPVIVCLNFNITAQRLAERKIRELQATRRS